MLAFLTEIFEIIIDLQAVIRNNVERSHVPFTQFSQVLTS